MPMANVEKEKIKGANKMKKPRCSIALCPWKAKYGFEMEGYYECWFHGGDYGIEIIWDIVFSLPTYFYRWMKYEVCLGWRGSTKWALLRHIKDYLKYNIIERRKNERLD